MMDPQTEIREMAHVNLGFFKSTETLRTESNAEPSSGKALNSISIPAEKSETNLQTSKNMTCIKLKCQWIVNFFVLLSISGLIIILEFDLVTFRPLGFQCKDPNLSYKFSGDTIPFGYLMAISIIVPLISMLLVEFVVVNSTQNYLTSKKEKNLRQAWHWYSQFFLGFLILIFLIQLGKSLIAEPRPHFFDTCKPDKAINCTSEYIIDFICTNKNLPKGIVRDSIRSFPSGHSALGMYVTIFMTWFLQVRIPRSNYLIVPWIQCVFLSWGIFCALTRITDRRHHWWDVLAGSIFGSIAAAFTVKIFCRNFHCQYSTTSKSRGPDKNLNDTRNNVDHSWNRKLINSGKKCDQPLEDRELGEVK